MFWSACLVFMILNPKIFNIIQWVAGCMGRSSHWPSVWCSTYNFFHNFLHQMLWSMRRLTQRPSLLYWRLSDFLFINFTGRWTFMKIVSPHFFICVFKLHLFIELTKKAYKYPCGKGSYSSIYFAKNLYVHMMFW